MAGPTIWAWSSSADDNGTADTGLTFAEGQAPSTVNNSCRMVMKRVADLLKDLGGTATAGGTANALTLTSHNTFTAYEDGLIVSFRAPSSNTDEATLNVNTVGTKPIVQMTGAGETALSGGEIQKDGIYELVYSTDLNGSAGAWLLINPSIPVVNFVQPGTISAWGGANVPDGYLACNGAAASRTAYANLFAAIGTTWGNGDGSTTFNLPDLRDEFLRGWSGTRAVGTAQTDALKSHLHGNGTLATAAAGNHSHSLGYKLEHAADGGGAVSDLTESGSSRNTSTAGAHTHTITGSTAETGDTETRPQNKAVLWIIKT